MGGNIFQLKSPEYPDFGEEERKWEALRIAQQQRKLQAAQSLMQMARFNREQEDWKREDAYRNALSNIGTGLVDPQSGLLHPKAAETLLKIDPSRTFKLSEDLSKSAKEKAAAAAAKEATDQGHRKLGFFDLKTGIYEPDPQKRLEYTMNSIDRWKSVGLVNQDELEELAQRVNTPEDHARWLDRVGTRVLGAEYPKLQKEALDFEQAQKDAAAKNITRPAETTKTLLESEAVQSKAAATHLEAARRTGNQDAWTQARNEVPVKDRGRVPEKLDPTFDPLILGMSPSEIAMQQQREMPDNAKKLIIKMNEPGVTPEQKEMYAKDLEQMLGYDVKVAEATAGGKPMSAEASKVSAIAESMVPEARLLQEAIRKGGRNAILAIMTKTDPKLSRLADNVADKLGRLRSGGAVNPSEEARFMAQLARWADLLQSGSDMSAPIEAIERIIEEANTVSGHMQPGQKKPAAAAPTPTPGTTTPAPSPLLKPGSVIVRTPDGAFTFPNQAEADAFKKKAGLK